MLNGIDPIIIFNFSKLLPSVFDTLNSVPVVAGSPSSFPLPVIPIYLSEQLTGISIDSESKNLEIDTQVETKSNGDAPKYYQRGITSTVKISMIANRRSLGVSLFAAMADLIFPKVTSQEYSVTYLHGAITVFGGLLHSFSIDQTNENDLMRINLELQKPPTLGSLLISTVPVVNKTAGATLGGT